jgi:Oxysterol-binding protein
VVCKRQGDMPEYHHAATCAPKNCGSCRLAWVLGFAMGPYGCMERTWKPFNPILGETFEVELDKGVRFFAEQVRWNVALHQRMYTVIGQAGRLRHGRVIGNAYRVRLPGCQLACAGVAPPAHWHWSW